MAGSCVIENVAKDQQAVVGASWCGSAVIVEPSMHLGSGDLIEAQGTECRQQTGLKTLVSPQDRGRLASANAGVSPCAGSEVSEQWNRPSSRETVRHGRKALVAGLPERLQGNRPERHLHPFTKEDVTAATGRVHPNTETGNERVADRVFAIARFEPPDKTVGQFRSAVHCAPLPRTAATASAASTTFSPARCVYLRVVPGSLWPSSRPTVRTFSPCMTAMLANVWRRS